MFFVCSEHQELARLVQEQSDPADPGATANLEAELSCVVDRLESKLEQIQVVKGMLSGMRHQGSRGRDKHHHPAAPSGGKIAAAKKHSSSKNTAAAATSSSSSIGSQASLEMLRKMKTVQQKLERDDLSWD